MVQLTAHTRQQREPGSCRLWRRDSSLPQLLNAQRPWVLLVRQYLVSEMTFDRVLCRLAALHMALELPGHEADVDLSITKKQPVYVYA